MNRNIGAVGAFAVSMLCAPAGAESGSGGGASAALDAAEKICVQEHQLTRAGQFDKTPTLMSSRLLAQLGGQTIPEQHNEMAKAMTPASLKIVDRRLSHDGKRAAIYGEGPPSQATIRMSVNNAPAAAPTKLFYRGVAVLEGGVWKFDGSQWADRPLPILRTGNESPRELYAGIHALLKGNQQYDEFFDYLSLGLRDRWQEMVKTDEMALLSWIQVARLGADDTSPAKYAVIKEEKSADGRAATLHLAGKTRWFDQDKDVKGKAELVLEDGSWNLKSLTWEGESLFAH
jgi:hypothetical protein